METIRLLIFFLFGITIPAGFLTFGWSMILTNLLGLAPYVPSAKKSLSLILSEANLKKSQIFYDLGSGDGVVLETAVKNYQVKGVGVEINPFLVFLSRLKARFQGIKNLTYIRSDFLKANLAEAQVIFLYLLPRNLPKLQEKIEQECQKGTLIISNSFPLNGWEKKLAKTTKLNHLSAYYYQL